MAVLLAYTKLSLRREILASDLPDDPLFERDLLAYFPTPLREGFADDIRAHPLRREIIATAVVNGMVNQVGSGFVDEMQGDAAYPDAEVARAYSVVRDVFDLCAFWRSLEALEAQLPAEAITGLYLASRGLTEANNAPIIGGLRIIFDLPALVINLLITYLVYRGIKESRNFSNVMVILKLSVVLQIILVGGYLVFSNGLTANWTPINDEGVKSFMPNGFSGVMKAVAGVFFAYIGFDTVSVLAEESKNPQRDLPRVMVLSSVICTIIYFLLTLVLTGAVHYKKFDGVGDPLAFIFEPQNLSIGWMQFLVAICAVVAMTSVLLVFQMGQPRIWMSMRWN